jgi:hypothetical protein
LLGSDAGAADLLTLLRRRWVWQSAEAEAAATALLL